MSCSSCGTCANYEALTRPRRRRSASASSASRGRSRSGSRKGRGRQRNFGARVLVKVNGKQFWAHKKKGNPANFARLHPKLRARAMASKQVAAEMRARGQRVDITSATFQRAVAARAAGGMRRK